jgi:clan AA aspartic protease (TIGR02281 family)
LPRWLIAVAWLGSVLAAFALGLRWAPAEPVRPAAPAPAGPAAGAASVAAGSEFRELSKARAWPELAALAAREHRLAELVELARRLAEDGEVRTAIALLDSILALEGRADALFALSDLLTMDGRLLDGLEPLFRILEYPESPATAERARARLELLVTAREQQLANIDDVAGLVRFFDVLARREPSYDGHRLKLALWLLRSGQLEESADVLEQVGYVGVTEAEREAVAQELELASAPLPFERAGAGLYADVLAAGRRGPGELRLLVDTGATTTALTAAALERLGAERLDRSVRVATAGGAATMAVYRLAALRVGALEVRDLEVLALPSGPRDADGLLGMDVLDRLPKRLGSP